MTPDTDYTIEVRYDRRLKQRVRLMTLRDGTRLDSRREGDDAEISRQMRLGRRRWRYAQKKAKAK